MTIRSWFEKRWRPPRPRPAVGAGSSGAGTAEPQQRDDFTESPPAEPSDAVPDEKAGETILVAVCNAEDEDRGRANLTDDVAVAERLVVSLVKSGVKPESVSALRATEVPLNISYEWTVEIGDKGEPRPQARATASPSAQESGVLSRAAEFMHELVPEAPFQLRFDRVVWLGLWATSLFILGLLLVASLSGGSAREFVVGGQPSPSGSVSASNVTGSPSPVPSASPGVSASPGSASLPSCLQGSVNNCQCQDFASQGEAQKFFTTHLPPVRQPIDPDGDGLVCEWLPKLSPSPTR